MDYSYFDALIDSVFVVNSEKGILYCNEAAAALCESSVRRLTKEKPIEEIIEFSNSSLFQKDAFPMTEMNFKLKKDEKSGKVQLAVHPFTEPSGDLRWIVIARDVTLEEVLHAKYHKQLEEKEDVINQLQDAKVQLEAYSKNLEQMVEERTQEVKRANLMLNAIMDSLGQGFLVFDKEGMCGKFYTKACVDVLETTPEGKNICEVLNLSDKDSETFKLWMQAVFSQSLEFDSLKDLAPQAYEHSQGKHVNLDYFPIYNESKATSHIVVVATDWTAEFEANAALEKEKQYAKMVIKLVSSKNQFEKFLVSCDEVVAQLKVAIKKPSEFDIQWAFRMLHTLEGEAATYSVQAIWHATRAPQELLEPYKNSEETDFTKVSQKFSDYLDEILMQKTLFLTENKDLIESLGLGKKPTIEISMDSIESIIDFLSKNGVSSENVSFVESQLKSQPVKSLFGHYHDVVQGLAARVNKRVLPVLWENVDVKIRGEKFEKLAGTFIHAFRNAIDHGIEPSEDREMLGKPSEGQLQFKVEVYQESGADWIRFKLSDDGQGIHAEKIKEKLSKAHPDIDYSKMDDYEIIQHVFDSGLSTRDEVGELSGRGIGMNAIKDEAEQMGGHAFVESSPPNGSVLTVEVPMNGPANSARQAA